MFMQAPLTLSILSPLYTLFGWIMSMLYSVITNYGLDIIIFTVFLRAIMIPLYVKNHKTQLKQMQLQDEINELKRYYGSDKQGFSMAQMELMKKHKISMMGGCLPSLLGLLFIWPIWRIISQPLLYIMKVGAEQIQAMGGILEKAGLMDANAVKALANQDIPLLHALRENGPALSEAVSRDLIRSDQLINLNFLGMNLGLKPTISPDLLFHEQSATYLPLLIIPIVAVVTSFLASLIGQWTSPTYLQAKRSKELAKKNPARDVIQDQTQGMMKSMLYMMPLVTLITVFTMPAAMGLYWIVGNFMMIVQSYVLYWLYTKPVLGKIAEQDASSAAIFERSK